MDLEAQIKSLEGPLQKAMEQVLKDRSFIQGAAVESFNKNFLNVHGGSFGIGCANGTSAITVALRALGIGPGDEVLVPNHTFIGTAEPIVEVGAVPVLVDIDREFHQFDLKDAERKLTKKTKCMIPVHLYGMPEPMDQIMDFARSNNLKVIEDCAQAQMAKWNGQPVGTFGDIGTFSFYPGKNLGAFGDAGFILTQDQKLFTWIKKYINHARQDKYVHEFFGGNFRMDGLQGAVLDVKLTKLAEWSERRRELAKSYDEQFTAKGFRVLKPRPESTPVYHLYVIEVGNRDNVMEAFDQNKIGFGVHYPVPLNQQPAFQPLGYRRGQFPVSEKMATRIISLPFFPEMTLEQMGVVSRVFLKAARP
jgi:dTDP-4-amino-4,6-dideoxygalactose transaminase